MNLLFDVLYPVYGGLHNQAFSLNAPLKQYSWNTSVLLLDEKDNAAQRLRDARVYAITNNFWRMTKRVNGKYSIAFKLFKATERQLPDIISQIDDVRHYVQSAV